MSEVGKIHLLKTDPKPFQSVLDGDKRFEIRFNDRGYGVGDTLILRELKAPIREQQVGDIIYTGRAAVVRVTYVLDGPYGGLGKGWCVLGITGPLGI